jgi:signal transduction histidine kinase
MDDLRVLIVDDDTALLQALPQAIALRMTEVKVETSDSATGALQMVQQTEYDAIVSDIKMPGMDGLALIERLRECCPDVPTLLITGHGERDLAIRALRAGAYDFIQKPIDRDYFISALQRAIQTRQMRRKITQQQQALEAYNCSLKQSVEERTAELVEANAAKDIFLSMVSHELRTPLTTLKGVSQVLHYRVARGESVEQKHLQLLQSSVHRMELLVNDLLDASQLETGMFSLHCQPYDLIELCRELVDEYQDALGATLRLEILAASGLVGNIDRERISQGLLNLISNAKKYSPEHTPILLRVEQQGDHVALAVVDRGVGIEQEKLEHIFERFYRVPGIDVQRGSHAGIGLGLYITKRIVERHSGYIKVSSTPGHGSTFTIYLPLLQVDERSDGNKAINTQMT